MFFSGKVHLRSHHRSVAICPCFKISSSSASGAAVVPQVLVSTSVWWWFKPGMPPCIAPGSTTRGRKESARSSWISFARWGSVTMDQAWIKHIYQRWIVKKSFKHVDVDVLHEHYDYDLWLFMNHIGECAYDVFFSWQVIYSCLPHLHDWLDMVGHIVLRFLCFYHILSSLLRL